MPSDPSLRQMFTLSMGAYIVAASILVVLSSSWLSQGASDSSCSSCYMTLVRLEEPPETPLLLAWHLPLNMLLGRYLQSVLAPEDACIASCSFSSTEPFSVCGLTCLALALFPPEETSVLQWKQIIQHDMLVGEQFQPAARQKSPTFCSTILLHGAPRQLGSWPYGSWPLLPIEGRR